MAAILFRTHCASLLVSNFNHVIVVNRDNKDHKNSCYYQKHPITFSLIPDHIWLRICYLLALKKRKQRQREFLTLFWWIDSKFNSLVPERCSNFKGVISKYMVWINFMSTSGEIITS